MKQPNKIKRTSSISDDVETVVQEQPKKFVIFIRYVQNFQSPSLPKAKLLE